MLFLCVEVCALAVDHTTAVAHNNVFTAHTERNIQIGTRHSRSTSSVDHKFNVLNLLALHLQSVKQSSARDDGRSVLVIVHHWDVALSLKRLLDFEALRSLDVLKVNATKRRSKRLYNFNEFFRVLFIDLNVEAVKTCKYFKKESLTLHYWLTRLRTNVAEAKHSRSVGDYGYKVALVCIFICVLWIFFNLKARISHTWRISQG